MATGLERFRQATAQLDLDIREVAQATHTAREAADAVGAPLGAIVKSLLFMAGETPVLVLVSGSNMADLGVLEAELGEALTKASADQVKQHTGWSIGGVPPIGHPTPLRTLMDEDFFTLETLWAAAGSADAVFPVTPARLQELAGARIVAVC